MHSAFDVQISITFQSCSGVWEDTNSLERGYVVLKIKCRIYYWSVLQKCNMYLRNDFESSQFQSLMMEQLIFLLERNQNHRNMFVIDHHYPKLAEQSNCQRQPNQNHRHLYFPTTKTRLFSRPSFQSQPV